MTSTFFLTRLSSAFWSLRCLRHSMRRWLPQTGHRSYRQCTPGSINRAHSFLYDQVCVIMLMIVFFANWHFFLLFTSLLHKVVWDIYIIYLSNYLSRIESVCLTAIININSYGISILFLLSVVFQALRNLSTRTSILTTPKNLRQEALDDVMKTNFPSKCESSWQDTSYEILKLCRSFV